MGTCFEGGYGLGSLANHPLYWVPSLPTVRYPLDCSYWGLNLLHCYPHFPRPHLGVSRWDPSNHTLKGAPSRSLSEIVLFNPFKVQLNYIIKLNRIKTGATYMAQNLEGVN